MRAIGFSGNLKKSFRGEVLRSMDVLDALAAELFRQQRRIEKALRATTAQRNLLFY